MNTPIDPNLTFAVAAQKWLSVHERYIQQRTIRDYRQYLKPLNFFFGKKKLNKITIADVREYQTWRRQPHPEVYRLWEGSKLLPPNPCVRVTGANAQRINQEIVTVRLIMREAGTWKALEPFYERLPVSREGSGKSLTAEEEKMLMEIAFSRPKWRLTAHCLRVMFKTGCGFGELRQRRRADIDLDAAVLVVTQEGAKNVHRQRTIPLIPEAIESMNWILERWERIGGSLPEHFILPARRWERGNNHPETPDAFNLNKPMQSLHSGWKNVRKEAAVRIGPKMARFRIYDARVTAITRTLSDGQTPLHAAQRVFGHVSQEMQKRYFKPEADMLRKVLKPLETKPEREPEREPEPAPAVAAPAPVVALDGMAAMTKAAILMRDTGITIDAALEIVEKYERYRSTL